MHSSITKIAPRLLQLISGERVILQRHLWRDAKTQTTKKIWNKAIQLENHVTGGISTGNSTELFTITLAHAGITCSGVNERVKGNGVINVHAITSANNG